MAGQIFRRELVDLTQDTEETALMVDIAGKSLKGGELIIVREVISDETPEGRARIKKLIQKGWQQVEPAKKEDIRG
ncbi:MAG: hypothetical protein PHT40_02985 [Patescibacteria group bacterium]|nr:hypothetical protein [Patescibacteria group bacterium]